MSNKSKLFQFKQETAIRDILFIPLFLSLYFVFHFFQDINLELSSFVGRPISVASSEAIDVTKRVSSFYNGFFVFIILALSFSYLIFRIRSILSSIDLQLLNATSVAGTCLLFFQVLGAQLSPTLHLVIAIQLVIVLGIALKAKWKFSNEETVYSGLFTWIITLSFSLYFLQAQLFAFAGISGSQSMPVFICSFSSVLLIYYFLLQGSKPFSARIVRSNIFITAPLAWIPLLSVAATEFYMILNQHAIHKPGTVLFYALLLVFIILWMVYRNLKWKKLGDVDDLDHFPLLGKSWFPALCIGIAALAAYKPVVSVQVDWFEDANKILPLQQWFEFGKIPFLDTFSSHALSDFGTGILFGILNAYHPYGGFVYSFIIPVAVAVLIYYFIFRITDNGFIALFVALFYPYTEFIIPSYYNLVPISILALMNVYRKQSPLNYFTFFLVLVLMVFWRIDLGSANLVAGIGALVTLCFAVPDFKTNRKELLKGLTLVAGGTILIFLVTLILYSGSLFGRISEALAYMSSFQSYGLKELSNTKDIKYFSLYFVLPVAVLLALAHAFYRLIKNKENSKQITYLSLSILFLGIFFLVNFQRGLVRHTLAEYWDTALTSYGFLILALGVFFNHRFRENRAILFFIFISASTLLVVNYKFSSPELTRNNLYFSAKQEMHNSFAGLSFDSRIDRAPENANNASNYHELDAFMKNNFADSSTFLDFSNSPMLYHYLNRVTPNYFCQIPHTAHNDKLQADLLEELKNYDIPVVVFSNVPYNFWDNLDGIPNTLRHYRISEYIYTHYKPYAIINKHCIWLKRDTELPPIAVKKLIDLNSLSGLEVKGGSMLDSATVQGLKEETIRIKNICQEPVSLADSLKYYMNLRLFSTGQGSFAVLATYSGPAGKETRKSEHKMLAGQSSPFIILENKAGEQFLESIELLFPAGGAYSLSSIQVCASNLLPDLYSTQAQEHGLKFIPYVWGNYDESAKQTRENKPAMLFDQKYLMEADREIRIKSPTVGDKSEGNYLVLKARSISENPVTVILNYGYQNEKYGGFTFTVMNSEETKDYRIRISSQYNWTDKEIEWISLYSVGEGIELESVQLIKGD
jgi:hypothetical protein